MGFTIPSASTGSFSSPNLIYSDSNINDIYFINGNMKMKVPDYFFLFAGQSNCHGQGIIDPLIDTQSTSIYQLVGNKFQIASLPLENSGWPKNDKMGFHFNFCKKFLIDNPGKTIAIVLSAQSGTSFGAGYWNKGDSMYNAALKAASTLIHMGSTLTGIIWHQGEADSTTASGPNYQTNLQNFVTNIRSDLPGNQSQVPFICGTMADDYINNDSVGNPVAKRAQVNSVHRSVSTFIDYSAFADLSNLPTQGDNLHFNNVALRIAGNRLYSAFKNDRSLSLKQTAQAWAKTKMYSTDGISKFFKTDQVKCLDEATSFSVSLWIKWDSSATATKYLFYKWDGSTNKIGLTWQNSILKYELGTVSQQGTIASRSNRVHHIVITFNGANAVNSRMKLYLDGSSIGGAPTASEPTSIPSSITDKSLQIATRESSGVYHAGGYIEAAIWQNELSAANVSSLYNNGTGVDSATIGKLKHLWVFGDNTNDSSSKTFDNSGVADLDAVNILTGDIGVIA